ncbi:HAD-IA family hydrolase [Chromobacterium subtsugae]|uniref:HAD-IA family hydrolase n=1 Tax=Chromobacterium subtsugae TaxID=251747 RepID=A0ABS7FGP9_9NEIS|nr:MULTISPECIES: HAD-IA family hydrolase [Chromobacterium]MBW7568155.1 HAD-IA family hydrolase [Chromobacterium subtsugae]MBW8289266.1 HAD-IA family hydrolase [Chromobacterium subtsugae]WSE90350.1 HAD-IA family hydrolase [Chromobacterium subtsugae]WVH58722.1 HAD-IA family hydrolase [Chromobacterium subtsugae]
MREFDLVVFDWDGTLMDSTGHIVHAIQQACRDLDLPVPGREAASHVIGLRLDDALLRACPAAGARLPELTAAFRRRYQAGLERVTLFEHAQSTLQAIRAAGIFVAIATGSSRAGLDRALQAAGIQDLFDATRTVDECHSKPHPDMLFQLTDYFGVACGRALMVGDTSHDLLMARNAGSVGVGISHGAHADKELLRCQPAALVHSLPELSSWLLPRLG